MRISSKGRYGLAAMVFIALQYKSVQYTTIISIAEKLNISKIYLEQVFSLLRRAGLVLSVKGAQGGYRLARPPHEISALQVLKALELSLFEDTEKSVEKSQPGIENAISELVYAPISRMVSGSISGVTLADLADRAAEHDGGAGMFYI